VNKSPDFNSGNCQNLNIFNKKVSSDTFRRGDECLHQKPRECDAIKFEQESISIFGPNTNS
jgi:hypothetical protein